MPDYAVAPADALADGTMKQVQAGDTDVLLVRLDGAYYALHGHCTHYGGPLAEGVLSGDRVVCPWHHACFAVRTGSQLEPPGLDDLPRYPTRVQQGQVFVSLPDEVAGALPKPMARRDPEDARTLVVLGAGAAGAYAAEAARAAGFTGRLCLVTREADLPYDRPNCSKDFLAGEAPEAWMTLRSADFYAARDIEVMTERAVAALEVGAKALVFEDGERLAYDTLVLCPGGRPRRLDVPGAGLEGVHTLRSYADSKQLLAQGREAGRVVVVGSSFIGMESAAAFRHLGCEVAVVSPEAVPFAGSLGEAVGGRLQRLHEAHGVQFHLGRHVAAFEGEGAVEHVRLDDGTRLDADLVLVGIGVVPATDFVQGLAVDDDGGLPVDEHLQAADGLFVAGDVARFPDWRTGEAVRIEHWRLACQHGRVAGANAAGRRVPYRGVPFFWTAHYDLNLRYVGHVRGWDEVVVDGDVDGGDFIVYYVKEGRVLAAAGVGRDQDMAAFEELMRRQTVPTPAALRTGVDLVGLLRGLG